MIIARFSRFVPNSAFLIKKSCSKLVARWGWLEEVGLSVGASSFGWFLRGFGWFLKAEDHFG